MYDALKNAGVKEEDARAAATEAARSDMRSITLEYAINKLRSHVDKSMTELRSDIKQSQIEMTKIMLLSSATSAGVLAVAIAAATYFIQIL